ncbi:MAG: HypC/HybG/HupF family hydrogenase formation chaperone [Patescibacteria group bacterium]
MCLTKPVQIKKINGRKAELSDGRQVNIALIGKVKTGDWVLANADLAVKKITAKEAAEINNYLK